MCVYYLLVCFIHLFAIYILIFIFIYIIRMSNHFESLLISTFLRQKSSNKQHIALHIFLWHLVSYENKPLAAPFGPLTPGSVHCHATFLTRDLRAPSGGSEYHLEVRESWLAWLPSKKGFGDQITMKFLFCQDVRCVFKACFRFVSTCSTSFRMHLFRMSETAIDFPTRDLSQLPLLPTKVMGCEGWSHCSWWNMWRLWKCWNGLFPFSFMLKHVKVFISFQRVEFQHFHLRFLWLFMDRWIAKSSFAPSLICKMLQVSGRGFLFDFFWVRMMKFRDFSRFCS